MTYRNVLDRGASPRLRAGVCALVVVFATAAPQVRAQSPAPQPAAPPPAQNARVLTLDERHFRSLRGSGGKPFRILPADL